MYTEYSIIATEFNTFSKNPDYFVNYFLPFTLSICIEFQDLVPEYLKNSIPNVFNMFATYTVNRKLSFSCFFSV